MATNFPTGVDTFTNPVSNDSLNSPSHSVQHANANDAIEAIEGYILNGTGAEWKTYAPTLSGGWSNGNGTYSSARYAQIGKIVTVNVSFSIGSTTTIGTNCIVSLPVNTKSAAGQFWFGSGVHTSGMFLIRNTSGSVSTATLQAIDTATAYAGVTNFTTGIPRTWVTGNFFAFNFTYEAE
jgi:hypothetical protein